VAGPQLRFVNKNNTTKLPTVVTESSSADEFANYFIAKVNIRAATTSAPLAEVEPRAASSLSAFYAVTTEEIISLLKKVPPKHCDLDPVPTWLVKEAAVVLAPALCQLSSL